MYIYIIYTNDNYITRSMTISQGCLHCSEPLHEGHEGV